MLLHRTNARHVRTLLCGVAILVAAVVCGGCGFGEPFEDEHTEPIIYSVSVIPAKPRAGQTIDLAANWSGKRPATFHWVVTSEYGDKFVQSSSERPRFGTRASDAGHYGGLVVIENSKGSSLTYVFSFTISP